MRYDIYELIQNLRTEMEETGEDYSEEIAELEVELNVPYTRIEVSNEVTLNTLRKIAREQYYNLDVYAEHEQPFENFDNGFVTKEWLTACLNTTFKVKANGKLPKSTVSMFDYEKKALFIKSKLEELLKNGVVVK